MYSNQINSQMKSILGSLSILKEILNIVYSFILGVK